MPPLTRRRALLAATSSIAALAGCAGMGDRPTIEDSDDTRTIDDYELRRTRNEDGAVLFARSESLPTVTDGERGRYVRSSRTVVVSEEGLDELTFGEVPEADRLQTFATATDFESSSLYLFSTPIEACYDIRLRSVAVESSELEDGDLHPHADFCKPFRPADVDCDSEDVHTAGIAIRLPVVAERSTGGGGGMSRSCDHSARGETFDATVTPADGGDDE